MIFNTKKASKSNIDITKAHKKTFKITPFPHQSPPQRCTKRHNSRKRKVTQYTFIISNKKYVRARETPARTFIKPPLSL